jgi:hypothetical protein
MIYARRACPYKGQNTQNVKIQKRRCKRKVLYGLQAEVSCVFVMKQELKRIGVVSMMKVYAVVGFVLGLIYGAIIFLLMLLGGLSAASFVGGDSGAGGGIMIAVVGLLIAIAIVFMFTIVEAIVGGIMAIVYNVIAGSIGGIEIELAEKR